MTRTFTWAAGTAAIAVGLAMSSGCLIKVDNSGTGGGNSTGTNTTSGSNTTSGGMTTGSYSTGSNTTATTGSGIPTTCTADPKDDTCTACNKASCCAELEACGGDTACSATYGQYSECLNPAGGDWSGYSTSYCQAAAGAASPAGKTKADALITCLTTKCSTDSTCGAPHAQVTWDNFAVEFMENYCNGCHFPGFSAPDGKSVPTDIPQFTDDDNWQYWPWPTMPAGPKANSDWKTQANYDKVAAEGDKIWCGVSVQLPDECASKFPGHFPTAERFPPDGKDPNKAQCIWNEDASCPAPTDFERNQMASWIFDGKPKQ